MNAQTVVDTFAPFVGTEGLRGIVGIRSNKVDPLAVVIIDDRHEDRSIPYDIAHGFLLSRLAEGLAARRVVIDRADNGVHFRYTGGAIRRGWEIAYDYTEAILAAARVEWPKRKPELVAVGGAEKRVLETLLAIRDDFDRRIKALGLDQTHPMMRADSD